MEQAEEEMGPVYQRGQAQGGYRLLLSSIFEPTVGTINFAQPFDVHFDDDLLVFPPNTCCLYY